MNNRCLKIIFWTYILFHILIAVLPLNSSSSIVLGNVFVVHIRLDYLLHAIIFIPWTFLYFLTFRPVNINDKLSMVGIGLLMAFATEGVQYFLTYRSYNINDLLSNFLGVLLGSLVMLTNIPSIFERLLKKE
jgi:VanZ family protein